MDVQAFRGKFKGVRGNRYSIICPRFPNTVIYVKAASFPGSQVGMIPVSYAGRIIKFGGERQFAEWSMQVYDTSAGDQINIRQVFEDWMSEANHPATHQSDFEIAEASLIISYDDNGATAPGGAPGSATLMTKKCKLYNPWPIDISPIDLSYEAADSFAEFTLTMAYDYHQIY